MAALGIFYVQIIVPDLVRAKRFYGDVLGWTLGTDEPGVAGYSFGTGYLVIGEGAPGGDGDGGFKVSIQVDDIEAQHDRLTRGGVSPTPIVSQPWGEKSFSFRDPDGHVWSMGQVAG